MLGKLLAEWFRPESPEELKSRLQDVPGAGQRQPVETWAEGVGTRGDIVFALEAPEQADARVDWNVWIVYYEFVSVSPDRKELAVGVIGND